MAARDAAQRHLAPGVGVGFDTQLRQYLDLGLGKSLEAALAGWTDELDKLRTSAAADPDALLVLPASAAPASEMVPRLTLAGSRRTGILDPNFGDPALFHPVGDVPLDVPHLVTGFEPGVEYRNDPPAVAVPEIERRGRVPLTIEEGLAVLLHRPETLRRNACWSLAGSSRGDRRVPALWISKSAPRLGWCYLGAPHTWLGTASVARRILPTH